MKPVARRPLPAARPLRRGEIVELRARSRWGLSSKQARLRYLPFMSLRLTTLLALLFVLFGAVAPGACLRGGSGSARLLSGGHDESLQDGESARGPAQRGGLLCQRSADVGCNSQSGAR